MSNLKRIFFLTRLKDSASALSYDEFVRSMLRPLVADFRSVVSYEVFRIHGLVFEEEKQPDWDYIDVIDVQDIEAYEREVEEAMRTEAGQQFEEGWLSMVDEWLPVYGTSIDEPGGSGTV